MCHPNHHVDCQNHDAPFTGLRLPVPSYGWQLKAIPFCTIISLTCILDCHPMTYSLGPIGLTAGSMTFLFGAALCMCWIKQFKMVSRFHVGIPDQNIMFSWVSPKNMQASYLWISACHLAALHPSFMLFLMIGLPPLLPVSMIFLTSTVPTGPSSLVNLTISTLLMKMMFTKWKWKKLQPPLLTSKLLPLMRLSLIPSTMLHPHHYQLVHHLSFSLFNRESHQS